MGVTGVGDLCSYSGTGPLTNAYALYSGFFVHKIFKQRGLCPMLCGYYVTATIPIEMKSTKVQTLGELRMTNDALLVALDTLMRFVAWSDKLYSTFLLLWNTCWQHLQFQP